MKKEYIQKQYVEQSSGTTPDSGFSTIYPKTGGAWYGKDSAGNEVPLSPDVNYITPSVSADILTLDFGSKKDVFANKSGGGAIVVSDDVTIAYSNATNSKTAWMAIETTTEVQIIFPSNHKSDDDRWYPGAAPYLILIAGFYQISLMDNGAYKSVLCSQKEL